VGLFGIRTTEASCAAVLPASPGLLGPGEAAEGRTAARHRRAQHHKCPPNPADLGRWRRHCCPTSASCLIYCPCSSECRRQPGHIVVVGVDAPSSCGA